MQADLVIRNARVADYRGEFEGGVAVVAGKIAASGESASLPRGHRIIDAAGRCLLPGVVDTHCHLGVAYPYAEDMRTETAQAARGGLTTVLLYIRNKQPSYIPFYSERRALGEAAACIDFGFHFGIQREEHIHEIPAIVAATGVQSFKLYFGYEPDNPIGIVPATDGWVYATMRALAKLGRGVVSVHCENTAIAAWVKKEIVASGRQDLGAYTESRPVVCEVETIRRMIFLAERTRCPLQLVHTSVGEGPDLAAEARSRGVDVTVETCPHYLTRTAYDGDLDMRAKISPPLRDEEQKEWLWRGLLAGKVNSLGSDHVPFLPKKGVAAARDPRRAAPRTPATATLEAQLLRARAALRALSAQGLARGRRGCRPGTHRPRGRASGTSRGARHLYLRRLETPRLARHDGAERAGHLRGRSGG